MIIFEVISIKNCPPYFFNNMINIKTFDPNLLGINTISCKSTDFVIYNIKYITMKNISHLSFDNENPSYLISNNLDGYIEESNGDKYIVFASTDNNKEVLKSTQNFGMKLKIKLKQ